MLLADPLHKGAPRHLLPHSPCDRRRELGADISDPGVASGQLKHIVDTGRPHQSASSASYICATRSGLMLDLWCQLASFSAKARPLPLTVWQMIADGREPSGGTLPNTERSAATSCPSTSPPPNPKRAHCRPAGPERG